MTYFWVLYSDWRSVMRFFLCPLDKGATHFSWCLRVLGAKFQMIKPQFLNSLP